MLITYDPRKRENTLAERGLDFEDAREVFAGVVETFPDLRRDYGEARFNSRIHSRSYGCGGVDTAGRSASHFLDEKANEREQRAYRDRLGEA